MTLRRWANQTLQRTDPACRPSAQPSRHGCHSLASRPAHARSGSRRWPARLDLCWMSSDGLRRGIHRVRKPTPPSSALGDASKGQSGGPWAPRRRRDRPTSQPPHLSSRWPRATGRPLRSLRRTQSSPRLTVPAALRGPSQARWGCAARRPGRSPDESHPRSMWDESRRPSARGASAPRRVVARP